MLTIPLTKSKLSLGSEKSELHKNTINRISVLMMG
jgi:hypothetical protein